jgi:hypothetical protein
MITILVVFFSNIFFSKSNLGFEKWTFINVQKRKPEKSFEKGCLNRGFKA